MINRSLLTELTPDLQAAVESSVKTIGGSGVLEIQLAQAFESIVSGALDEDADALAARILQYRRENYGIIAFKALADELRNESNA